MVGLAAWHDNEPAIAIGAAIVFACAGLYCLLWARTGVIVDDTGVTIRSIIRRPRHDWSDIVSFGLKPGRTRLGERLERPGVSLVDGDVFWIHGIEPPGRPLGISNTPMVFPQLDELEQLRREHLHPQRR